MIEMVFKLIKDQQQATGEYGDHLDQTIQNALDSSSFLSEEELDEVQAARLDPCGNRQEGKKK